MQTVIGVQRRCGRQDTRFLGLLHSNFNTKSPRQRTHLEQLLREAAKYVFPGPIVARDRYAEAVAERVPVWRLKRRSAQETRVVSQPRSAASSLAIRVRYQNRTGELVVDQTQAVAALNAARVETKKKSLGSRS